MARAVDFRGKAESAAYAYALPGIAYHPLAIEPTVVQRALDLQRTGRQLTAQGGQPARQRIARRRADHAGGDGHDRRHGVERADAALDEQPLLGVAYARGVARVVDDLVREAPDAGAIRRAMGEALMRSPESRFVGGGGAAGSVSSTIRITAEPPGSTLTTAPLWQLETHRRIGSGRLLKRE